MPSTFSGRLKCVKDLKNCVMPKIAQKSPAPSGISRRPKRVALLVDTSTSWGRRLIQGANSYAMQNGNWQLFVEARGMEERLRLPTAWQGDGIIARISNATMAEELHQSGLPAVNISGMNVPQSLFPSITTDQDLLANVALEHLTDRGFTNFAYFSIRGLGYVITQRDAFASAVRRTMGRPCAFYELKSHHGPEPDWNADEMQIGAWLRSLPLPIGVLVWNAGCGRAIINAAHRAGLLVPEDVAVLSGADDDVLCECIRPPLSAILVDAASIGFRAARRLDEMMKTKRKPPRLELIPPLRVQARQSTDTLAVTDPALKKALSYIREQGGSPIKVAHVTRASGISRRVLERRFLRVLGRSPAEEIRRIRLERAKTLLQNTSLDIPSVAEASGFSSPEYFAFYYGAKVGMTPLQFRKHSNPSGQSLRTSQAAHGA
jgi:LacI family transcriptional regulator